jgi:DNA polymerase-1
MAYLLNPSRPKEDLASLAREWLTPQWTRGEGDAGAFDAVGRMDALAAILDERIRQMDMEELYTGVELALEDCLVSMEHQGMYLNRQVLEDIGAQLDIRIREESLRIYELAGEEFNIGSPKQLGVVLFEKLGLTKGKKTKTGYSTDADILETLAQDHEIAGRILNWRQYFKLKTTYVDGLLGMRDSRTGKVHTSLNQRVTATGRLSSTEPNLQNIPVRMEEGRRIRKAFEAGPGNMLLAADYSQIELRVLAHIAEDPVLTDAFRNDQDIHARTAAEVFGIPMDQVTPEMRRAAKAVNFGIVYGISDFGLAQNLGITRKEAGDYIEQYFRRYPGVRQYQERVLEEARKNGFVKTLMNRRRYLPDIQSRNYHLRSFTERAAINTPIQGTAADIIKLAMVRVFELLKGESLSHTLVLQVHDELIFDLPEDCLNRWSKRIQSCMEGVMELDVPLKADLKLGNNWYDMRRLS